MTWRVFGESYELAGNLSTSDTSVYQPVIFNRNTLLIGLRTWVIAYNNPTFTDLYMRIYSNDSEASIVTPKKIITTSTNLITKTSMMTLSNAIKEIYFEFDQLPLNQDDTYHFVLHSNGYTPSTTSFLTWMKGFPDPVYSTNLPSATMVRVGGWPFQIYFIAGSF